MKCKNNHVHRLSNNTCCLISAGSKIPTDIATWMQDLCEQTLRTCSSCPEKQMLLHEFVYPLPLLALDFAGHNICIDFEINVPISNRNIKYKLRGIIYFGDAHFTSRVLLDNGSIWFHDGILTKQRLICDGMVNNMNSESLRMCRGRKAVSAVYIKC